MEILLIFFLLLVSLLFLGVPVAVAIAVTSIVAWGIKWGFGTLSFGLIGQMMVYGINNFPILAVPLFLSAGAVMNAGGISDRIFGFAACLVGHTGAGSPMSTCWRASSSPACRARRRPTSRASARSRSAP